MEDYVLLKKQPVELPEVHPLTLEEFRQRRDIIESFQSGEVAIDFETNTYNYVVKDFYVRCVGISNGSYTVCVDLLGASEENLSKFKEWLLGLKFVAHNACFECGTLLVWAGGVGNCIADTQILHADLASEFKRSHSLATCMDDHLGQQKEGDKVAEHMKANKWGWSDVKKFDFNILGHYCAVDAWGCWEMYQNVKKMVASYDATWGQYYWDYHREDCLNEVYLQVEARFHGITVDVEALEAEYISTVSKKARAFDEFLTYETIKPHIERFNEETLAAFKEKEPPKFTKAGKVTSRYTKWQEKLEEQQGKNHFNSNSTQQLRWLFFDQMGLEPIEFTPGGDPSTAATCLAKMGKPGELLLKYREYTTRLKFISQIRDGLEEDKTIKPSVRVFGTLSTRCVSAGV